MATFYRTNLCCKRTLFTFFKIIMPQYQSAYSFLEILSFSCVLVLVIQKSGKRRNCKIWSSFKHFWFCWEQSVRCLSDSWKLRLVICSQKSSLSNCVVCLVLFSHSRNSECTEDASWLAKTAAHSSICQTVETEQSVWLAW